MSIKATLMLLNPLKPSDYVLQFLTLKNYTFYPCYCICVLYGSQNKPSVFPFTALTDRMCLLCSMC